MPDEPAVTQPKQVQARGFAVGFRWTFRWPRWFS